MCTLLFKEFPIYAVHNASTKPSTNINIFYHCSSSACEEEL